MESLEDLQISTPYGVQSFQIGLKWPARCAPPLLFTRQFGTTWNDRIATTYCDMCRICAKNILNFTLVEVVYLIYLSRWRCVIRRAASTIRNCSLVLRCLCLPFFSLFAAKSCGIFPLTPLTYTLTKWAECTSQTVSSHPRMVKTRLDTAVEVILHETVATGYCMDLSWNCL